MFKASVSMIRQEPPSHLEASEQQETRSEPYWPLLGMKLKPPLQAP